MVAQKTSKPVGRMLDLGSGDGFRGRRLFERLGAKEIVFCDSSREMVELCRQHGPSMVVHCKAENLPKFDEKFDLIICLWNVLGHVETPDLRIEALHRMRENLQNDGCIFLDINNRHNARAYGRWRVLGRKVLDTIWFDSRRGDVNFNWNVGGTTIPARGHLFTVPEISDLVDRAGLAIREILFVDYIDGSVSRKSDEGQILLHLQRTGRG